MQNRYQAHTGISAEGRPPLPEQPNPGLQRVAVYSRYSTDGQKQTSIDDQVRTCCDAAARHGLTVASELIFADEAITGDSAGVAKREQYHALREAVRNRQVDVIFCDQQCRLARNASESLTFFEELKSNGVRLITADGFDSEQPTARLLFGIKSVFSEFFLDETKHRVRRGLIGEFGRGAMVTAIPYGYQKDVIQTAAGGGCRWCVNEEESLVVKDIFLHRTRGASFSQIAAILNGRGIPTPGSKTVRGGAYWRSAALWRIVQNPIYKGIYTVNFGGERRAEAGTSTRFMPELAIVSEEDWEICQGMGKRGGVPGATTKRCSSGGGKHALAGLFRCGVCGATLSCHGSKTGRGSLHCVQCEHATRAGVAGREPLYVSIAGVQVMLRDLLERIVVGEAMTSFRERLKNKLDGGLEHALLEAKGALDKATRTQQRLGRLLQQIDADDAVLEQQYLSIREEVLRQERRVGELTAGLARMNQSAIQKQLDVDLSSVIEGFLSDAEKPERTRALLKRIFPSIVLLGKEDRYTALFEVHVKPAAIVAEATATNELISEPDTIIKLRLRTSGSKYPVWSVEELLPA